MAVEEQAVEGSLADARRAGDDDGAGVGRSWFGVSRPVKCLLEICLRVAIVLSGRNMEDRGMSGRYVEMAGRRRGI